MATVPVCTAGPNEYLRQILIGINEVIDSGGGGAAGAVNITAIDGTATSTGCGAADAGTLRVAQATDCLVAVQGSVANDSPDANNPIKIGGVGMTTNPTAVTNGDRVNAMYTKSGRAVVVLGAPRELKVRATVTLSASVAETTLLAAGAAGVFHDLEWITIANTSGTAARIDFRDTTGGAVQFSFQSPAGATVGISLSHPIFQTTAASNWTVQSSASVTDLRIATQAHKLN